jgi:hypothetical protein
MKVAQLIEQLQDMDPNADVHFSYNYGDHWRTQVAATIDRVDEGYVEHSDYHNMDKVIDQDDFDDEDTELPNRVVLLS